MDNERVSSRPRRWYGYSGGEQERSAPDYGRVAAALSDRDLVEELRLGRGADDYRAALAAEVQRRTVLEAKG